MKKSDKPMLVDKLAKTAQQAKSAAFINYQGMGNTQLVELRKNVRKAGGEFVVAKNTLLKLALQRSGYSIKDTFKEGLTGPTAVIFAMEDELAPLQALAKSIKDTELPKLKFGLFNLNFIDKIQLSVLSQLPSKAVLQANLIGAMLGPQFMLVGALQGNLSKLVYVLDQKSKQQLLISNPSN